MGYYAMCFTTNNIAFNLNNVLYYSTHLMVNSQFPINNGISWDVLDAKKVVFNQQTAIMIYILEHHNQVAFNQDWVINDNNVLNGSISMAN